MYAITESYPWREIDLPEIPFVPGMRASILGCDAEIAVADCKEHAKLIVPPVGPEHMKSEHLHTFRIEKE